jgi:hypothetical protein
MKDEPMNTFKMTQSPLKAGVLAPLALVCLAAAPHARADSVLLAQTSIVSGTESSLETCSVPKSGTVSISLESLSWPTQTSMSALSFAVTSSSQVLASWNGSGLTGDTATFDVGAGTYYAHITGTASSAGLGLGLYSVLMTFAPSAVPLPSSGWMLLTGLFVLAGLVRAVRPFELTGTAEA